MPPTSHFVLAAAGVVDGSAKAGDPPVGAISLKHVYEIAKVRLLARAQSSVPCARSRTASVMCVSVSSAEPASGRLHGSAAYSDQ